MLAREFPWARDSVPRMCSRLRALGAPVMLVLGSRDRLVRGAVPYAAKLRDAGAQFDMRVIDGGGHAVNEECASRVVTITIDFLRAQGIGLPNTPEP